MILAEEVTVSRASTISGQATSANAINKNSEGVKIMKVRP
jgi:hypothetical protein